MLTHKRGDIPYLLGLVFFMASVIYFFASNWPAFERPVKIALSLTVLLFCAAAAFLYQRSKAFSYLSNWWLFLSVIGFAVSLALVGQIYNSHADSYTLFLITFIPAVLLAVLTCYRPLYWLSFLLFELAFWLKLYPTGVFLIYSDGEQLVIYLGSIGLHAAIYFFWQKLGEQKLSFVSLIAIHYCAIYLLVLHPLYDLAASQLNFRFLFLLLHFLYIGFIFLFWKSFIKTKKRHPFEMGIHFVFFGVYTIWNVFYFSFELFGGYIFYSGFPLLLLLFAFSVLALKKIKSSSTVSSEKWVQYTVSFFTGALAFTGTIIAVFSLSSFVAFFFAFSHDPSFSFIFLAAVCIAAGLLVRKEAWLVVRITLQVTGLVFSFFFMGMQWENAWTSFPVSILFAVLVFRLFKKKEAILYYVAANTAFLYGTVRLFTEEANFPLYNTWIFFLVALVNAFVFMKLKSHPVGIAAFWLSLAFMLFSLTEKSWASLFMHFLFLIYVVSHLIKPMLQTRFYRWPLWGAAAGFIIWKYYEYAWLLLHKSITFLFISVFFFALWFVWGKHHTIQVSARKWSSGMFAVLVLLQFTFVIVTAWQKEQLLQNGEVAALELVPLDPRSLLQGDYVQLSYQIQTDYRDYYYAKPADPIDGSLEVVLKKSDKTINYNGKQVFVYEAAEFVPSGTKDHLFLRGKSRHGTLALGIESFFIPENTGSEWEEKSYAIVRIAKNGDAVLETLR